MSARRVPRVRASPRLIRNFESYNWVPDGPERVKNVDYGRSGGESTWTRMGRRCLARSTTTQPQEGGSQMDRPRNPDEDDAFRRRVAESVDSDADDDAIGTASYAVTTDGPDGGRRNDEHEATPVGSDSGDDTHEATAVGGGTIYSTTSDSPTQDPLDASGMQSGSGGARPPSGQESQSGGTLPPAPPIDGGAGGRPPPGQASDSSGTPPPPPPERGFDERGQPIPDFEDGGTTESSDDGPETYAVREGVTRAIDPEDYSSISSDQELAQETTHNRVESMGGGFEPQPPFDLPPDLPESVDVTNVAPDGTRFDRTITSPTGEVIDGSGMSDAIQSRAGALGGDALGRGIDFDPTSPGTDASGPGGQETTGDPSVDRAIMGRDGSLISEQELPKYDPDAGPRRTLPKEQQPAAPKEDRILPDWVHDVKDYLIPPKEEPKPPPKDVYQENPEGDSVDSATNLERVTVMQGSAVNPSTNPNDGGDSGTTDNYIPPADLETMPAQEGAVAGTTLTSAAGLGSSPVTNPTDPVFGDDGIIHGGNYSGGGGTGGGETTPLSSEAEGAPALQAPGAGASSLGGGEAALPITLRTGPAASGGAVEQKTDVNGATVDMVTGQVIGSAAPASGVELSAAGGMVSQGDEGDDDDGVQALGAGADAAPAAAPSSAFTTAAPLSAGLAAGGMVSQGDEGDDDDGAESLGGADPGLAIGGDTSFAGGAPAAPGAPEGAPPMGDDGPGLPGEEG